MTDGSVLMVVDTKRFGAEPRMVPIDPLRMVATAFASNDHSDAPTTTAGTWSSALGRAVLLDTTDDVLRSFAAGENGPGTILRPTGRISAPGTWGEHAALIEIDATACAGTRRLYGSGHAGRGGHVPSLTATGCPSPGASLSLHLSAVGGTPGAAGAGALTLPLPIPATQSRGATFTLQGVFLDAAASAGLSMSHGLELVIG